MTWYLLCRFAVLSFIHADSVKFIILKTQNSNIFTLIQLTHKHIKLKFNNFFEKIFQ